MNENQLIEKLLSAVEKTVLKDKSELINKACQVAKKAHHGQTRKSAEIPFLTHPIETALILLEKYADVNLVIAGVLHDTVEDSDLSIAEVYQEFGEEVGFVVDAMNKNIDDFYQYPAQKFKDKTERLLWAGKKDIRCLLVKIADRQHNLETIGSLFEPKQKRMAFESQAIYMPLRKVLQFNEKISLPETVLWYQQFIKDNNCQNEKGVKDLLIQQSFGNINKEMFGIIYNAQADVIWEITNRPDIKKFIKNNDFSNNIELVRVCGSLTSFKAEFKFKKGMIIEDDVQLNLANSKS